MAVGVEPLRSRPAPAGLWSPPSAGAARHRIASTKAFRSARRTRYFQPGSSPLPGRLARSAPDWIQVLTVSGMTWSSSATCPTVKSSSRSGWLDAVACRRRPGFLVAGSEVHRGCRAGGQPAPPPPRRSAYPFPVVSCRLKHHGHRPRDSFFASPEPPIHRSAGAAHPVVSAGLCARARIARRRALAISMSPSSIAEIASSAASRISVSAAPLATLRSRSSATDHAMP